MTESKRLRKGGEAEATTTSTGASASIVVGEPPPPQNEPSTTGCHDKEKHKLNHGLNPEKFWICVPWNSSYWELTTPPMVKPMNEKDQRPWECYLREIEKSIGLAEEPLAANCCCTCPCPTCKKACTKAEPPCPGQTAQPAEDFNSWSPATACSACTCADKTEKCKGRKGWILEGAAAVEHARRVHEKIHRHLLKYENVSAVDVGFAIEETEKIFTNLLAIRIHVSTKRSTRELERVPQPSFTSLGYFLAATAEDHEREWFRKAGAGPSSAPDAEKECVEICARSCWCSPGRGSHWYEMGPGLRDGSYDRYPIPGVRPEDLSCRCCRLCICGVPLDIVESWYSPASRHPGGDAEAGVFAERLQTTSELSHQEQLLIGRGRVSPLVSGVSIGNDHGQTGTLTAVVWDRTDGTPCLLGNWHVLAGGRNARIDQPVYQPSYFDGGTSRDTVAHLKRWHLGEEGDVAIAELSGDRDYNSGDVLGMWDPIVGTKKPKLNMEIRKWGRTTGYTEGFIDGIHVATNIDYGQGVIRHFKNQFHIAPLCQGQDVSQTGDSGAMVLTRIKPQRTEAKLANLKRQLGEQIDGIVAACKQTTGLADEFVKVFKARLDDLVEGTVELSAVLQSAKVQVCPKTFVAPTPPAPPCPENEKKQLLKCLEELGFDVTEAKLQRERRDLRNEERVTYAVGMIFAGDTPGSPFGEFALASDIDLMADLLRFSLRPVFEPRSSFRRLRTRRVGRDRLRGTGGQDSFEPGDQRSDPRGTGPQPVGEPLQVGPGNG